jgi:hypothetical protein
MSSDIHPGDCVQLPDGRIGRVRERAGHGPYATSVTVTAMAHIGSDPDAQVFLHDRALGL